MMILEFMFDSSSSRWVKNNVTYNLMLLSSAEGFFNAQLTSSNRVALDEVLRYLDIPIPPGMGFYGWDKSINPKAYISFNFRDQIESAQKDNVDHIFIRFEIPMDNKT